MDEKVRIKEEKPLRSSPDSSTDPWSCPQCGLGNENEAKLLEHLLIQHQIRVVQPQNPNTTRCPVCRKHVADLSSHFALEHGQECKSEPQMNGNSLTRIIPVVLNGQPALQTQLTERSARSSSSDLNNVTIIPMNGSGSTRSSTPNSLNNDNPVNLSMPRKSNSVGSGQNSEDSEESVFIGQAASALGRKRRKQTQVPEERKMKGIGHEE